MVADKFAVARRSKPVSVVNMKKTCRYCGLKKNLDRFYFKGAAHRVLVEIEETIPQTNPEKP